MEQYLMKNGWLLLFFYITYIAGLICFTTLFYIGVKNIFLTYYVIIVSIILITSRLFYWFKIKNYKYKLEKDSIFLIKLAICVFTYIAPIYCIIQEPFLIVNQLISIITLIIVTSLSIIGIIMEKWLSNMEIEKKI
tara:strand:+ start:114 stop:521 length:408 start_codon:yes stop_codon:yes gene_type:complete